MAPDPIFFSASHGVFAPTGHARGPWDADALHGGAPAALIVRTIEELGTGLALGRLTIDYLGPVPLAPLTLAASVVRPGRRFAVAEATVEADGRRRCFARGADPTRAGGAAAALVAARPSAPCRARGRGAVAVPGRGGGRVRRGLPPHGVRHPLRGRRLPRRPGRRVVPPAAA